MDFVVMKQNTMFITLPSEVDHHYVKELAERIDDEILQKEPDNLVFDFGQTTFMDSSGIGLMIGRYRILNSMGGKMYIRNVGKQMQKILELSGVERIIGKYEERL